LLQAKVLLIGAGGLGSPAALYLAAAGVGRLGIADSDTVELSNLQRQVIHDTNDIGRLKVSSAAETITEINPDVEVVRHDTRVTATNVVSMISDYDIIVDGSDNFPTRYVVNDACVLARKPFVYGSVWQFEGQATVFTPGNGCYRCLYPKPPSGPGAPSCQDVGVFGVLPGIIGTIEATEAIKLIIGVGQVLTGRLLLFNALDMDFRTVKWKRNPDCPICGDHPTITKVEDYRDTCQS